MSFGPHPSKSRRSAYTIAKGADPVADARYLRGPKPNKALYCSFKSFLVMQ